VFKPANILLVLAVVGGAALAAIHILSGANDAEAASDNTPYTSAADIIQYGRPEQLSLQSSVALIVDDREGVPLYDLHADRPRPIASLTKLMTALVILESGAPLDEVIKITREDRDRLRGTKSRLPYNGIFSRHDLLRAALGASDNRAAAALARTFPAGEQAMMQSMNQKAAELGMTQTRFEDASGLRDGNVSTANDLLLLVEAIQQYPEFQALTTTPSFSITNHANLKKIAYRNTNRLVHQKNWDIALSKTGYTAAAGNCLIMQVTLANRPLTIVLLNSWGKLTRYGDARRIQRWLEKAERRVPPLQTAQAPSI